MTMWAWEFPRKTFPGMGIITVTYAPADLLSVSEYASLLSCFSYFLLDKVSCHTIPCLFLVDLNPTMINTRYSFKSTWTAVQITTVIWEIAVYSFLAKKLTVPSAATWLITIPFPVWVIWPPIYSLGLTLCGPEAWFRTRKKEREMWGVVSPKFTCFQFAGHLPKFKCKSKP